MKRLIGAVLLTIAGLGLIASLIGIALPIMQISISDTALAFLAVPLFVTFILDLLLRMAQWGGTVRRGLFVGKRWYTYIAPNTVLTEAAPHAPAWMLRLARPLDWFAIASIVLFVALACVGLSNVEILGNWMFSSGALHFFWLVLTFGYSLFHKEDVTHAEVPR